MMTRTLLLLVASASLVAACAPNLHGAVDRDRLHAIVERDAILFETDAIPEAMVVRVASKRVVIVGEYHDITHHEAFVGELAAALRPHGFGTVLLEYPQAESWLLDAYASGMADALLPGAERTYGTLLERIRVANADLPPEERIRVAAIDVNPRSDDFLPAFRGLLHQIGQPEPFLQLVAALEVGGDAPAALAAAQADLAADEGAYRAAWGDGRYDVVLDALDGEARSAEVRAMRAGAARDEAREAAMHAMVDRQLAAAPGGAIVNVGLYHAQKTRQDGSIDVWLAERLRTTSDHARGSVFSLAVMPARGEAVIRGRPRAFDVGEDSPANELLRVVQRVAEGAIAFLPLRDAAFAEERVVVNYLPRLHVGPPKAAFDGFVVLPEVAYAGR
ncbi:MAG: hypothetical protein K0A98_13475 [Trueperaceae bacterium]|nr:hypothetical protein [Trueperaceae bacterium]